MDFRIFAWFVSRRNSSSRSTQLKYSAVGSLWAEDKGIAPDLSGSS
jgi:hypothetical protein